MLPTRFPAADKENDEMKNLSLSGWLALAAITVVPATIAIAATSERGWHGMSDDSRARLDEGKLALAKAALKLTPDQEKLWTPIETQLRDAFKKRDERRAEWMKKREERKSGAAEGKKEERANMAERFEKMSQRLSDRAERMKAFSTAFTPFYTSLSDEQKDVLRPVMREIAPFGGRKHGPRWAMGDGWGPGGRHHGHHGWFEHGDRGGSGDGGPAMKDDGPDQDGGQATPEPDKTG
jgi:hypothetical protein